jgi:hypothetical protein
MRRGRLPDVAPCAKGVIASFTTLVGTQVTAARLEVVWILLWVERKYLRMMH